MKTILNTHAIPLVNTPVMTAVAVSLSVTAAVAVVPVLVALSWLWLLGLVGHGRVLWPWGRAAAVAWQQLWPFL